MLSNSCETGTTNYDFTVKKRKFEVFRRGYFRFISPGRLNLHRPSSLPHIESPGPTSGNIFLHTNKLKNNNIKLSTNDREILRGQNEERHPTVRKSHGYFGVWIQTLIRQCHRNINLKTWDMALGKERWKERLVTEAETPGQAGTHGDEPLSAFIDQWSSTVCFLHLSKPNTPNKTLAFHKLCQKHFHRASSPTGISCLP